VLPDIEHRQRPSPYLEALVADGKLGFKSGEGFSHLEHGATGGTAGEGAATSEEGAVSAMGFAFAQPILVSAIPTGGQLQLLL